MSLYLRGRAGDEETVDREGEGKLETEGNAQQKKMR